MRYTFYLDESGSFQKSQHSLIGGYILPDIELQKWEKYIFSKLELLEEKYQLQAGEAWHRSPLKKRYQNSFHSLTQDLLSQPKIQFISLADPTPENDHDTYFWYVSMAADLIGGVLYKLFTSAEEPIIELNFVISARKDIQQNRRIEKESFQQAFESAISQRLLQLGIPNNGLKTNYYIHSADKYAPLVLADHFCNALLNRETSDRPLIQSLEKKIFYDKIRGEGENSLHNLSRDYFNMLSSYLLYKRSERLGGIHQKVSQKSLNNIIENLKFVHLKDERYFIMALRSILERTEYESSTLCNYQQITKTYKDLLSLLDILNPKHKDTLQFIVRTWLLAVANYSGNIELANECIEFNDATVSAILVTPDLHSYLWIYYNISAVSKQGMYCSAQAISMLTQAIKKRIFFWEWQSEFLKDLGGEQTSSDSELGKLYGSLGQAYTMEYIINCNPEDIKRSEDAQLKAIELFNSSAEHTRSYNYLMRLARVAKDEAMFLKYLKASAGNVSVMEAAKAALAGKDNYLKAGLLAGVLDFDSSIFKEIRTYLKEHKDQLITFSKVKSYIETLILRDWAYLLYHETGTSSGLETFRSAYLWFDSSPNGANDPPLSLIKASLFLAEYHITGRHSKQKNVITILADATTHLKTPFAGIFTSFIHDPQMPNWTQKLREKLYF